MDRLYCSCCIFDGPCAQINQILHNIAGIVRLTVVNSSFENIHDISSLLARYREVFSSGFDTVGWNGIRPIEKSCTGNSEKYFDRSLMDPT